MKGEQIDEAAVMLMGVIEPTWEPWVFDERWSKLVGRHVWRNGITGETALGDEVEDDARDTRRPN